MIWNCQWPTLLIAATTPSPGNSNSEACISKTMPTPITAHPAIRHNQLSAYVPTGIHSVENRNSRITLASKQNIYAFQLSPHRKPMYLARLGF